jgi:hypothetical protein
MRTEMIVYPADETPALENRGQVLKMNSEAQAQAYIQMKDMTPLAFFSHLPGWRLNNFAWSFLCHGF